jgi:hypothetical protein
LKWLNQGRKRQLESTVEATDADAETAADYDA